MAWTPQIPGEPRSDRWWHDVWIYQQEAAVAAGRRAERLERCRQLAHDIDMRAAGALQSAEWDRIQRRRDERGAHDYHGTLIGSWGAAPEVEHRGGGWVLSVQ
jgi:hypothetical protein